MHKLLVISYGGFSPKSADGKTLEAMLSNYKQDELAQFYCDAVEPDYSFCHSFFHVTDSQMIKSFVKKPDTRICEQKVLNSEDSSPDDNLSSNNTESRLMRWLRKNNYNFLFRFTREVLWNIAPWGKKEYWKWLNSFQPDSIFYMVGENWFQDNLVLQTAEKLKIPIILYNAEGYRLVDLKERHGIERLYYYIIKKKYSTLSSLSKLIIYNCDAIKEFYRREYPVNCEEIVAYNSSDFDTTPYRGDHLEVNIAYFGNLGVGRVKSIIDIADVLQELEPDKRINVYGNPKENDKIILCSHPNIEFHGFVAPQKLIEVKENADILLHVESFDPKIVPKLKYAFSTKIAQYLCAGRCVLCYAPEATISTRYLKMNECAAVATNREELKKLLAELLSNYESRAWYAKRGLLVAKKNHCCENTSCYIRSAIERVTL